MRSPRAGWAFPGQAWVHCSLCPSWSARRKTCLRWTGACSCRWRRTWRRLGECLSAGSRSLSCVVCGRPIVHASLLPEFPRSCDVPPLACSIQRVCGRDAPVLAKADSGCGCRDVRHRCRQAPGSQGLGEFAGGNIKCTDYRRVHTKAPLPSVQCLFQCVLCFLAAAAAATTTVVVCRMFAGGHSGRLTLAASRSQRQRQRRPEGGGLNGEVRPASRASLVCSLLREARSLQHPSSASTRRPGFKQQPLAFAAHEPPAC